MSLRGGLTGRRPLGLANSGEFEEVVIPQFDIQMRAPFGGRFIRRLPPAWGLALLALALSGCNLIDPFFDTKAAVREATGDPGWSHVRFIEKCPADPAMVRGTALVPNPDRKLRGISFVIEPGAGEGMVGPIHWMPHETLDLGGPILENRYFEKMLQCEFSQIAPVPEDPAQLCFASYCPCEGDVLADPPAELPADSGASEPFMSDFDTYMCQLKIQQPPNPILSFPAENVERNGLEARAQFRAAREALNAEAQNAEEPAKAGEP